MTPVGTPAVDVDRGNTPALAPETRPALTPEGVQRGGPRC